MKNIILISAALLVSIAVFLGATTKARASCNPELSSPVLSAAHSKKRMVNLTWMPIMGASRYALVYGLKGMPFMFGALNVDGGVNTNYTVGFLESGKSYTFQIWAFCSDNEAPSMSNMVTATAR